MPKKEKERGETKTEDGQDGDVLVTLDFLVPFACDVMRWTGRSRGPHKNGIYSH
jgi:hypothetical protein